MMTRKTIILLILIAGTLSLPGSSAGEKPLIKLDSEKKFQTIVGWEATATVAQFEAYDSYPFYKDKVFAVAADLGINRLRIAVPPNLESRVDEFSRMFDSQKNKPELGRPQWDAVNDDDDPYHIDPSGFQFSLLDFRIQGEVLPLKKLLMARGEDLFLNFCFTSFREGQKFELNKQPEEYAEFVLAVYLHIQEKFGIVPDAWEILNEPDRAAWSPKQLGDAMVAAGKRLKENGFQPYFIAPSISRMKITSQYFDEFIKIPGVSDYLSEFSYHCYRVHTPEILKGIADRAAQFKLQTSMTECLGADYLMLHEDLKVGMVSAWEQFTLAWPGTGGRGVGGAYFRLDLGNPKKPRIEITEPSKLLMQYFRFIRRGAVRIEASSNDLKFDPLAFVNRNGKYVVVVKAEKGGSFSVEGLPPGTYGVKYSTLDRYDKDSSDKTIRENQRLDTSISGTGVLTIYGK